MVFLKRVTTEEWVAWRTGHRDQALLHNNGHLQE